MIPPSLPRCALLAAALLAAACAAPPAKLRHDAADRHLEALAREGRFQGAVVIGRLGRVDYARGFGYANVAERTPFTPDTPSDGGSLAKTVTAAALLDLASRGAVDLEAPVARYVPAFPHAATRVRHLVTHGAGLPDYDWFDRFRGPPAVRTNADQVAILRAQGAAPAFAPGTRYAYDNPAYDTAAMVVEAASGRDYFGFVSERFFAPLGMKTVFLRPPRLADYPGVRTVGYRGAGPDAPLADAFEGEAFFGASNLYFSAMDLFRWASGFASGRVLDTATLARGLERARLDDGTPLNLGLLSWYPSDDGERHYYIGHHNGFYGFAWFDRIRGTVVAFVSNNAVGFTPEATALPRALVALAEGREPEPLEIPKPAEPAPEAFAAPWRIEGEGTVAFRREGERLFIGLPSGLELPTFRLGTGTYAVPGLDGWLRFHERDGRPAVLLDSIHRVAFGTGV